MKDIAIAYFDWGWIVVTAIATYFGWMASDRGNVKILWETCAIVIAISVVMLYAKYG